MIQYYVQLEDVASEPEDLPTDDDGGTVALLANEVEVSHSEGDATQTSLPQSTATYHCGIGPCKPKWLQNIVSAKLFTALLCAYSLIEGTTVSGKLLYVYADMGHH